MGEEVARGILQGRRKSIIAKMELRDQPILDQFQDEISDCPWASALRFLVLLERVRRQRLSDGWGKNSTSTTSNPTSSLWWHVLTPRELVPLPQLADVHTDGSSPALREGGIRPRRSRRLRSANTDMVHTSARSCAQQLRRAQNRHRGWSLRHEGQRTDADPRSLCQCDWLV